MANIKIVGNAAVLTSALKREEIATVHKYRPEALVLKDEEGTPYFRVGFTTGKGSVSKYGVEFDGVSHDDLKLALITLCVDCGEDEDIREIVADALGVALNNLNKVEAQVAPMLEEIAAERERVMDSITVQ